MCRLSSPQCKDKEGCSPLAKDRQIAGCAWEDTIFLSRRPGVSIQPSLGPYHTTPRKKKKKEEEEKLNVTFPLSLLGEIIQSFIGIFLCFIAVIFLSFLVILRFGIGDACSLQNFSYIFFYFCLRIIVAYCTHFVVNSICLL